MFTNEMVELASQKPFDMANWNNFVTALKGSTQELPKCYEWMKVYASPKFAIFFYDWVADVVWHYSEHDEKKAKELTASLLIGMAVSIVAGESIAQILQRITDLVS